MLLFIDFRSFYCRSDYLKNGHLFSHHCLVLTLYEILIAVHYPYSKLYCLLRQHIILNHVRPNIFYFLFFI